MSYTNQNRNGGDYGGNWQYSKQEVHDETDYVYELHDNDEIDPNAPVLFRDPKFENPHKVLSSRMSKI